MAVSPHRGKAARRRPPTFFASRALLAAAALLLLPLAGCTGAREALRPDPAPALAEALHTVRHAHDLASLHARDFVRARTLRRSHALQAWTDAVDHLADRLEHAIPRVRAPRPEHLPDVHRALDDLDAARADLERTLLAALPPALDDAPDDPLTQALHLADDAARAARDLLRHTAAAQHEAADRAWEAFVHAFNAWRDALERALASPPLAPLLQEGWAATPPD